MCGKHLNVMKALEPKNEEEESVKKNKAI
jgi:hypothetical protein